MMSSDSTPPPKDDDNNAPGGTSTGRPKPASLSSSAQKQPPPPPEQVLKCPRCDSPNTKFCYYNNYSLTQPRHFCKTCRRYWTRGGALRNVPIGGGCRKNKKIRSSSASHSRLSCSFDSKDSGSNSSDNLMLGGMKFLTGISPAMEFQLGRISGRQFTSNPASVFHNNNQFSSSFGDGSGTSGLSIGTLEPSAGGATTNSFLGFNYPLSLGGGGGGDGFSTTTMNVHSSLASSIESLSSINQDLHWKLQQQRLSMLFGGPNEDHDQSTQSMQVENQNKTQQIAPISLFQNLEVSSSKPDHNLQLQPNNLQVVGHGRKEGSTSANGGGDTATEWFFGNSYAPPVTPTPTNSGGGGGNESTSNWHGIQGWSHDLQQQYNPLP